MHYIFLDTDSYIMSYSCEHKEGYLTIESISNEIIIECYNFQYINNQFIHNPRPIELETEN